MSGDFHGQAPNPGWDGEGDDFLSDGYAAEREAKRTAHYVVTFTISYDPEEVADIRSWMTREYLDELIAGYDDSIDVSTVAIAENLAVVEPAPATVENLP